MQRGETDAGGRALAGSDNFQEPQSSVRAGIETPRYVQSTTASNTLEGSFHFPLIIHVLVTPPLLCQNQLKEGCLFTLSGGREPIWAGKRQQQEHESDGRSSRSLKPMVTVSATVRKQSHEAKAQLPFS